MRGEHMDILRLDLPRQLANAVGAIAVRDMPALSERTTLAAGRPPQGPGDVAIDTILAEEQALGVGDTIRLKNSEGSRGGAGPLLAFFAEMCILHSRMTGGTALSSAKCTSRRREVGASGRRASLLVRCGSGRG